MRIVILDGYTLNPGDGAMLTLRDIGGGSFGLGYARRRQWLLCPTCGVPSCFAAVTGSDQTGFPSRVFAMRRS